MECAHKRSEGEGAHANGRVFAPRWITAAAAPLRTVFSERGEALAKRRVKEQEQKKKGGTRSGKSVSISASSSAEKGVGAKRKVAARESGK